MFSAYVNTASITQYVDTDGDGKVGGLCVAFMNSSKVIQAKSMRVTAKTTEEIEDGWQRLYVTYTPA